uniref:NADH-ubiquinone oxidoreductase chain 4 n=1 Tax=Ettchellsia sinica TaxID=1738633 RepID=A0A2S0AZQ6_9HYME|nr:NADH dehydrogenase subunit 4 [Ettchellsia sinica]
MMKFIMFTMIMIPNNYFKFNKNFIMYNQLLILCFMWIYSFNNYNFMYSLTYNMMIDSISNNLILLSIWITSIMVMTNFFFKNNKLCNLIMLILLFILMLTFSSNNLIMFYLYFESSLIPTLILILGWGSYQDRIQASMYLMMYTLFASIPLLFMILLINKLIKSMNYMYIMYMNLSMNSMLYMMFIIAFLIKLPMFMFHLWLPKAHGEAPVFGSMILAAIMLKLGSYGLYRINLILMFNTISMANLIISITLISSIYLSIYCMTINDMKILIAYSSIIHMSLMLASMMTLKEMSIYSSIIMMIAHGLCSSGMFSMSNMIYERSSSRNLLINKSLINFMPTMTLMSFLLCSSNMSAPPSLNLISEIMLISSLLKFNNSLIILIFMMCFFSSIYSLYLFSMMNHGSKSFNYMYINNLTVRELMILMLHWMPLNMLFMNLNMF